MLSSAFFNRPVLEVAPDLLGKVLVRQKGNERTSLIINEVEAYDGPEDKACHAHKGKTKRNAVMFGPAGYWYVYLCYGMHWMLNIVTGPEEYPAAVLIRGAGEYDGPGKLTKFLELDKSFHEQLAERTSLLWIEEGQAVSKNQIQTTPRIGIGYAEEWIEKPYRFLLSSV